MVFSCLWSILLFTYITFYWFLKLPHHNRKNWTIEIIFWNRVSSCRIWGLQLSLRTWLKQASSWKLKLWGPFSTSGGKRHGCLFFEKIETRSLVFLLSRWNWKKHFFENHFLKSWGEMKILSEIFFENKKETVFFGEFIWSVFEVLLDNSNSFFFTIWNWKSFSLNFPVPKWCPVRTSFFSSWPGSAGAHAWRFWVSVASKSPRRLGRIAAWFWTGNSETWPFYRDGQEDGRAGVLVFFVLRLKMNIFE